MGPLRRAKSGESGSPGSPNFGSGGSKNRVFLGKTDREPRKSKNWKKCFTLELKNSRFFHFPPKMDGFGGTPPKKGGFQSKIVTFAISDSDASRDNKKYAMIFLFGIPPKIGGVPPQTRGGPQGGPGRGSKPPPKGGPKSIENRFQGVQNGSWDPPKRGSKIGVQKGSKNR